MDDPTNLPDAHVRPLEQTVERLTSELTALKLELATLHSALRDIQQSGRPVVLPPPLKAKVEPPVRSTIAPAAIVVLLAATLLTWQLITTPRAERAPQGAQATQAHNAPPPKPAPITIDTAIPTDPPITPLVTPTIYRGTLSVNADHPGASVFVNRRLVGTVPVRVRNLRAGAHLVWVESEGYRRWTRVVTVPAERVTRVAADLEPVDDTQ